MSYDDYSEFKPVLVAKGIDSDHVGPNPRQTPLSQAERQQFEQVRQRLDRALQACRVVPSVPQEAQTPEMYEASLLKHLAKHTGGRMARLQFSPQESPEEIIRTCEKHNVVADALTEPHRMGTLREIRTVDATGRTQHEFVGNKAVWMDPLKGPALASPIHLDGQPQRV